MNLSGLLLKCAGWTVHITVPDYPKCLICVAPHTSNWDFILGKLAYASVSRKAGFLMKETWFFPPLGWIFRAIGGIPVPRRKGSSLTAAIVEKYRTSKRLTLAVTPEGTRARTEHWRTGFLHIVLEADIPLVLGILDYGTRTVTIDTRFVPTGDIEADMDSIKDYYRSSGAQGKYPDKFNCEKTQSTHSQS